MKYQRCLYCEKNIDRYSLYHLFVEEDHLCLDCRNKLKIKRKKFNIEDMKCESFYKYDSLFKSLLIQYKECFDEALANCFLYKIDIYIKLKYFNYQILYVPSSISKLNERGFNHLELIFNSLGLKKVEGIKMKEDLKQEGKSLLERKKMIDNYIYEGPYIKRLLIVDDVCTSGSSLLGIYKAMKNKAGKIKALVLCKKE